MPSFESESIGDLSVETLTLDDISENASVTKSRSQKQAMAEAALAVMFDFEIPDQTLNAEQHVIFGEAIAKGDKDARNEYISHRMRSIMIAAIYRYNSQEAVVNLDLEDHFQNILENFIKKVDDYKNKRAEFPNFGEYVNPQLYWIALNEKAEVQALPFRGFSAKYRDRNKKPIQLFSEGLQPYHEVDPELQGSSTTEILDEAILNIAKSGLNRGIGGELTERNGDVLKMRTGILLDVPHTRVDVAEEFDITPERVRQIETTSIQALARATEVQKLKRIFEDVPEGEFLNQNTPPSLYKVKKAIERLSAIDKRTPEGRELERFVNTWKDHYFPSKKRRVSQTEAAHARFKIKQAKKYRQKRS